MRTTDATLDLALVLSSLEAAESPAAHEVADELQSLAAIYDDSTLSFSLYHPPRTPRTPSPPPVWNASSKDPLRLVLYPMDEPPLIQLQDRYLSSFAVSDDLFGQVLRTFMHDPEAASAAGTGGGVKWTGGVCLFEGIEYVRELCSQWVGEREAERQKGEKARQTAGAGSARTNGRSDSVGRRQDGQERGRRANGATAEPARAKKAAVSCPEIISCEPIVDRQSVFVGHVAKVNSLEEVDAVMETLLTNNKIAKATHNISAYQFTTPSGTRHADNDDDGETAAGSRLAHLLTLLDVQNVMVVVSRWYGGIHLGPDRFKLINQAARDALTDAGLLQEAEERKGKGGGAGKGGSTKKR
ncbi:hypothetical protein JCM10295v2_001038 [Rhodotorula toruloides]